ncbi:MAG: hypothetical protein IKW38_04765 [Kiritimatiellae bacterium]|nr:hypothetical protein [Kiritimatiellia bacterium]
MKHLLIACAAASALGLAVAQDNVVASEAIAPEETVVETCQVQDKDVQEMIDAYLAEKGWSGGYNTKKNGDVFFIAQGSAVVQAPVNGANYIGSRMNAFNKAMLDAKKQMVEYLGTEIASATVRSYQEGEFPSPDAVKESEDSTSICGKVKALLRAKLDAALRSEGIDPYAAGAESADAAKKLLASEQFSKTVKSCAEGYVIGLQAIYTCEGGASGDKAEIGVVALWSEKLQQMATSVMTGQPVAGVAAKKKVIEQIAKDPGALLSTFGVQQKIDEAGDLVLVSFAQAGGVSESKMAAKGAQGKAKTQAMALLREFAGEQVAVATDMLNAESTEEFEDATEVYQDTSAYAEKVKAVAEKIDMAGISVIRTWKAKHPLNGRTVYGCICAWSPKQANLATGLKKRMADTPRRPVVKAEPAPEKAKAASATTNNAPAAPAKAPAAKKVKEQPKPTAANYNAGGISGDEDAF